VTSRGCLAVSSPAEASGQRCEELRDKLYKVLNAVYEAAEEELKKVKELLLKEKMPKHVRREVEELEALFEGHWVDRVIKIEAYFEELTQCWPEEESEEE
jgi:hypothetical protein